MRSLFCAAALGLVIAGAAFGLEPDPGLALERVWSCDLGSREMGIQSPGGMAPGPDGDFFITDTVTSRITVVDGSCRRKAVIGRFGFEPGSYDNPLDLASDPRRNALFVADAGNSRIQVADLKGNPVAVYQGGVLDEPTAVAVDYRGYAVVADRRAHRLFRFDLEGRAEMTIGGFGVEPGRLHEPALVAVDALGRIWIWEGGNKRLQKFSRAGVSTAVVAPDADPEWGSCLEDITGLAVDSEARLWAWSRSCRRGLVFDPDGGIAGSVELEGVGGDIGLLDAGDRGLLILDRDNLRLELWRAPPAAGKGVEDERETP